MGNLLDAERSMDMTRDLRRHAGKGMNRAQAECVDTQSNYLKERAQWGRQMRHVCMGEVRARLQSISLGSARVTNCIAAGAVLHGVARGRTNIAGVLAFANPGAAGERPLLAARAADHDPVQEPAVRTAYISPVRTVWHSLGAPCMGTAVLPGNPSHVPSRKWLEVRVCG